MNNAADYAMSIAETLRMLDEIHYDWFKDDVATTVDRLREASSTDPDENARFDALAEFLENEFSGDDEDLGVAYLNSALDMWTNIEWRWNQQDIKSVAALITAGGPHAEIKYVGFETEILIEVTWGSDVATRWVDCAPVANAMSVVWDNTEEAFK
jgi:hypothetical protein